MTVHLAKWAAHNAAVLGRRTVTPFPKRALSQPSFQEELLALLLGQCTRHDGAGVHNESPDGREHTP